MNMMVKIDNVYILNIRCYSGLGMTGGTQLISIGDGCEYKGIVQHEILHALGRIHEQSRLDRDNYVDIKVNNVAPGITILTLQSVL